MQLDLLEELHRDSVDAIPVFRTLNIPRLVEQILILAPELPDLLDLVRIYAEQPPTGRAGAPEIALLPLLERRRELDAKVNETVQAAELALLAASRPGTGGES